MNTMMRKALASSHGPGPVPPGLDDMIREAVPQPFQHHQVLWELDQRPALLTGEGAHGSPRVNALIQALVAAGSPGSRPRTARRAGGRSRC
ncbi:MAG: hypothetical protein JWM19_5522 [Actinomycetia bacterium]|nr:hypothetical protein [Actinomycetes bacterium]